MRNVIVTGASRGLGLCISQTLAGAGYRVIAIARSAGADLKIGQGIDFRPCDLSDLSTLGPLVRELRREYGPLYGLVNNAGLGTSGVLSNMRDQDIERVIQLNTLSPILLSKYVVRSMMAQREGRIINVASIVASTGYTGLSVYSATKAALIGFTRSLAREVGQLGITVNALAPGFIATAMTEELTEAQSQQIMRRNALQRMAEPIDVARAAEYLLGDSGRNVTGTTLTIDAGNTA